MRACPCPITAISDILEPDTAFARINTLTGLHTPTSPDPDFKAKLRQLNPHQY
ncbi:hypothetical protein SAMN05421854_11079 [Amycolatopsis rubida]|uniref:Uncharacterized protein n=1 Tax=Amycolatopsis rubida TaxID=112413 RepID=A0A1I5X7M3_9PSEU|nr:hypothetical protein SAMN05421854_11079 [Amycolatopsis rubida]